MLTTANEKTGSALVEGHAEGACKGWSTFPRRAARGATLRMLHEVAPFRKRFTHKGRKNRDKVFRTRGSNWLWTVDG